MQVLSILANLDCVFYYKVVNEYYARLYNIYQPNKSFVLK